ncbi:DUF2892 domain-containing protein [Flavobacterium sp.]|uniref:YgaP family membrane protein n=1 Tax=Flavobacterium sp. TaxID=239 RepID=UPI003528E69B
MKKNIGKTDKIIRISLAIILVVVDYFNVLNWEYSWVLSLLGIILVGSTLIGFCPLYVPLGINTCKRKE